MGTISLLQKRPLLLLSSRPWNSALAERLSLQLNRRVESINDPVKLTSEAVAAIDPQWIFVPHWSHLIPESIWGSWPTVIFHMTDLPYGRGGSPLQNLIQRGHSSTVLTALRCCAGLDAGGIYNKQPLSLYGSAEEILLRADSVIGQMIEQIVSEEPLPFPSKEIRSYSTAALQLRAIWQAVRKVTCVLGTTRSVCSMRRVIPMHFLRLMACG